MPVPSQGWHVAIEHPTTSRTIQPRVLSQPTILPSLNSLPEIRIPVARQPEWLDSEFDDDPAMDVWLDGEKQPIDILVNVEDRQDQTILVGLGGEELRDRVQAEYRTERRHDAAENLIDNNTTYNSDVDTPTVQSVTGETVQNPTTTQEISDDLDTPDNSPIDVSNDEVTIHQTSFTVEGEDVTTSSSTSPYFGSDVSGDTSPDDGEGEAEEFDGSGQQATWDFTPQYDIPADDVALYIRLESNNAPELEVTLNGTTWTILSGGGTNSPYDWRNYADNPLSASSGYVAEGGGDLVGGNTYTVQMDSVTAGGTSPYARIDVVAPLDEGDRFGGFNYNFDNTLKTSSNSEDRYLNGPGFHPDAVEVMGEDEISAFTITDADITLSIDDTSGDQRVQLSNDRGSNWLPNDGTENNTNSVDVTFSNGEPTVRTRFDLAAYEDSGNPETTPAEHYAVQTVTDWTLNVDLELELLLVDKKYDQPLVDTLNDIAGSEFVWSYNLDSNGNPQVSWAQDGQRTANSDPNFSNTSIEKDIDAFDRVVIKGSNRRITEETFTANTSFESLSVAGDSEISPGSESVYNDTQSFSRFDDYEMDYRNAQIQIVSGSEMDDGTDYSIDYNAEIEGVYPGGLSNPDRELVESVPGVTSNRAAEQIAFVIFDDVEVPRYSGDVTVPTTDKTFDPLEALPLSALNLPSAATPLDPQGQPEITPQGIQIRLGSRPPLEESLGSIAETVRSVSNLV